MEIIFTVFYTVIGLSLQTFLGGSLLYVIYAIFLKISKKRVKWEIKKFIIEFTFCCYLISVLILTGVYRFKFTDLSEIHAAPNLIPLMNTIVDVINNGLYVLKQVVLNIIFYIPCGTLLGILLNNHKKIIVVAFTISTITETIQYFCGRFADVDDIIFNVTGALIGYGIYLGICRIKNSIKNNGKFVSIDLD